MPPLNRQLSRRVNVGEPIPNNAFGSNDQLKNEILLDTSSGSVVVPGATVINDRLVIEAQSFVQGGFDFGTF